MSPFHIASLLHLIYLKMMVNDAMTIAFTCYLSPFCLVWIFWDWLWEEITDPTVTSEYLSPSLAQVGNCVVMQ